MKIKLSQLRKIIAEELNRANVDDLGDGWTLRRTAVPVDLGYDVVGRTREAPWIVLTIRDPSGKVYDTIEGTHSHMWKFRRELLDLVRDMPVPEALRYID